MRYPMILALAFATAAATAHADSLAGAAAAVVRTPEPTAIPTMMCNPAVTPDPTFLDASYQYKWPHISLQETQRLAKLRGSVFVDGRSKLEWDQSHIKGAIPMPLGEFDKYFALHEKELRKAKVLIAYCHGKGCHLSDGLAQRLADKGLRTVAVFWGGFPEWNDAHEPLVDKDGKAIARPTPLPTAPPAPTPVTAPAAK